MARRSQCSSAGDNPLDPNYLPPHYREEYRLAIDALVEDSLDGYYHLLQNVDVVDFLSPDEIQYIQSVVQPPKQSIHPEQQFLDCEGEGSSDTYWPIHSDLDVPDLDLGWPQVHHFVEPTEVTTLVNPPEPDMPSIKEQARRLIKNAQQVIAIVMDMFTDVDIFADILNAAGRRVAVYILLDEHNADLFVNMVANCRVNLQAFPFIRVRTVSGITYQCRSGKTFKGQMMDRFLLTDCRAVLSGNYSFMWSFEKLHRCMAHLFLGQLVTTFDEEFRILFAQSQPLNVENMLSRIEDLRVLQKRQFPNESTSKYREPKRFLSLDVPSDDWAGHSYDEHAGGSLRIMAMKRQGAVRGPADMYNRYGSQQTLVDPSFDQGPARILMTDNPALKRHSYAGDVPGRYSLPFLQQQGMPDSEPRGKLFHRDQQLFPGPGAEEDYSSYEKFWNQGYMQAEQFSVPGLQQEVLPPEFDPVLNYLSSTRNLDLDQGSDRLLPPADIPFTSPHPKRRGVRQPYVGQTSPTSSNSDQKPFIRDATMNRKDPTVKQKLRNWRIGSYLSAHDNPEEEAIPIEPTQQPDPFEEPVVPIQQTAPLADLPFHKIPNVKEFKVNTVPRISQIPSYVKAPPQEKPKTVLDEPASVTAETKTTPTLFETSSTAEVKKDEEQDPKQTKTPRLQRDDSFRKKYNAAMQRSSRLRSSLIFSSLDQQNPQETTIADQEDEGGDKSKTEQTKLPLVSHVLGQRRSTAREPIEWSRYIKPTSEAQKTDKDEEKDSSSGKDSQDLSEMPEGKEPLKHTDEEQDSVSSLMPTFVDMNDPDNRLMFFKELAAQRKAARASEAQTKKDKGELKPQPEPKTTSIFQKKDPVSKETPETSVAKDLEKTPAAESGNTSKKDCNSTKTANEQKTETKKTEKDLQSLVSLSVSTETDQPTNKPSENPTVSNPLMPQSKSMKAELPKTDQVPDLTSPFLTASSYVDMNDPDNRLMFFKELAAKRKASAAKKGKEKAQKEPLTEPQNTSVLQSEQNPPMGTLESKNTFLREGLSMKNTMSPETSGNENTRKKDSLVKNDSITLNTSEEQAPKVTAETVRTDIQKQSDEQTETSQSKSPEQSTVSEPSLEIKSPKQANAADATVSSCINSADKRENLTLETVPVIPSLMDGLTSSESFQPETNICSTPLPSEAEPASTIGSLNPPEHTSTSDSPPLVSDLQKHPVAAKQTLPSDSAQEVYSPPNDTITLPPNVDEIKPKQESSKDTLEISDSQHNQTHLEDIPKFENTSMDNAKIVKTDVSPDKQAAVLEPNKLNSSTGINREEATVIPSVEGLGENSIKLEQEEPVAKECKPLESPEDPKAYSGSLAVCSSTPDTSLFCELGPEGSVSEQHLENTALSNTASGDTHTQSHITSAVEKTEHPQDTSTQNALSSYVNLTDMNAPPVVETALPPAVSAVSNLADTTSMSSETQPQSKGSAQTPNEPTTVATAKVDLLSKASDAVCPESQTAEPLALKDRSQEPLTEESVSRERTKDNSKQRNNSEMTEVTSNETKPKSEESLDQPIAQSLSGPTMVSPTDADLVCKPSEAVSPESQTPETPVPQESSKKDQKLVKTDEKKFVNLFDKDKSQEPSTEESESKEKSKDKQSNHSEITDVTSNETKPKSEESLDQPRTRSLNESTMVVPTKEDLVCKASEAVSLERQTLETPAPQESSRKEPELPETDEKKSSSLLYKDKSQKPSTEENAGIEITKDESKQSNSFETKNLTSNETQIKSEESLGQPTANSVSESTAVAPAETHLPCDTSEEVNSESQTPETPVPQECSKKELKFVETDEKKSNNLLDKDRSQEPSTEKSSSKDKSKDKQCNNSAMAEVTSNESKPKSEESLDQPTAQSLNESTMVAPSKADLVCKTSEAVSHGSQTPETPVTLESSKKELEKVETDEKKSNSLLDKDNSQKPSTEESLNKEKTKDESKQSNGSETEVTPKQPKSSQSRYHSSTVNVISSSNLRDDTKLLLGQISANSQSRNEATKDSPVTDDEKEDKADKNAKNEKGLGYRTLNRGSTKSVQEREQLLEKIQTMRKTRKVYSRFEMAP
ncbi:PREDICTED: protein FAM83H-like [Cyprinodon variegatus]|uniref:Protein FAM83H-like n=1 Tax=Cyprinodon variegatus TaxID=28743 RepID=A0A3Q2CEC1_CYPVA|nr:PREDICTED: protein FAM83H-like [Cyprinodon variegatus]